MAKVHIIAHKGKQIVHIDFADAREAQVLSTIEEAKAVISRQAPASALTLTDVTRIESTKPVSDALKQYAAHNKPYVKAGSVVGIDGLKRVIFNATLVFTGRRNLQAFDDLARAKDWLVEQAQK